MNHTTLTKNAVSKAYFSDSDRFAQICNNVLFGGDKLIKPEGLQELDAIEAKNTGIIDKNIQSVWKERDILKSYKDEMILVVLGIENQTGIHYSMPLRNMLYDTLNYEKQRLEIQKRHRKKKDLHGAEYISGFSKEDKLIPVFTLVIYYGTEEWDGPKNLHEMLEIPEALMPYKGKLADYHINFLDICHIQNLEQYTGELKAVLGFLKYQADQKELKKFAEENKQVFGDISYESAQVIAVFGNSKKLKDCILQQEMQGYETGGRINMGNAIDDMCEESRLKGIKEGKKEGIKEGREQGIKNLILDNLEEGFLREKIIAKIQKYYDLSEQAASDYFSKYNVSYER